MKQSQHTTGPWGIEQTPERNWIGPMRENGNKVREIVTSTERDGLREESLERNDDNAAVIAAAPELLRAMLLIQHATAPGIGDGYHENAYDISTAAIEHFQTLLKQVS